MMYQNQSGLNAYKNMSMTIDAPIIYKKGIKAPVRTMMTKSHATPASLFMLTILSANIVNLIIHTTPI